MSNPSTTTAATQPLVSFSFNLPADVAKLMEKACGVVGYTPAQYAANAVASLLCADTEYYLEDFTVDERFNNIEEGPRLVAANAPENVAESINVTLLREDLDQIIEDAEDVLRGNLIHPEDRCGAELIAYAENMTVEKAMEIHSDPQAAASRAADGFRTLGRDEIEEGNATIRQQAAYLRRILAARGA